jgi:hypothetical protein
LLTAPTQKLVDPILSPDPKFLPGMPYGPTIVKTETLPTGQEQVTMRVSTWDPPIVPPKEEIYDPRTYITTFTVTP